MRGNYRLFGIRIEKNYVLIILGLWVWFFRPAFIPTEVLPFFFGGLIFMITYDSALSRGITRGIGSYIAIMSFVRGKKYLCRNFGRGIVARSESQGIFDDVVGYNGKDFVLLRSKTNLTRRVKKAIQRTSDKKIVEIEDREEMNNIVTEDIKTIEELTAYML